MTIFSKPDKIQLSLDSIYFNNLIISLCAWRIDKMRVLYLHIQRTLFKVSSRGVFCVWKYGAFLFCPKGGINLYYDERRSDKPGDYFPLPKVIFHLGLKAGEIAVLAYLMYCENRKTHRCHPSYKRIGNACCITVNTVRKHVESLAKKGFICIEPTKVNTKDGRTHNLGKQEKK